MPVPHAGRRDLAEMKKTDREKDYAVIGELARLMEDPADQLLYSRSARDLMELGEQHAALRSSLVGQRPVRNAVSRGCDALEAALDAERRELMRAHDVMVGRAQAHLPFGLETTT